MITVLVNFTALVPVNNTPVVCQLGAASSWPCDSLPVSLDVLHNYALKMIVHILFDCSIRLY